MQGFERWKPDAKFAALAIIGLLSGTWPAVKASRLDPVEALRCEQ
jgi:ABC-type lipoprotein release transport system permease subunit